MLMYVLVYVDDLIIVHEDDKAIAALGTVISKQFEMRDLGEISYYLGIQTEREAGGSFKVQRPQSSLISLD